MTPQHYRRQQKQETVVILAASMDKQMKEQTASDEAFGIISQFRNEANADDIIDSSTFRHLQYLTNTAAALNGILAILPTKH